MDEPFSNGKMLPPGHPSCRCAVAYEEIQDISHEETGLDFEILGQYTGERMRNEMPDNGMLTPVK